MSLRTGKYALVRRLYTRCTGMKTRLFDEDGGHLAKMVLRVPDACNIDDNSDGARYAPARYSALLGDLSKYHGRACRGSLAQQVHRGDVGAYADCWHWTNGVCRSVDSAFGPRNTTAVASMRLGMAPSIRGAWTFGPQAAPVLDCFETAMRQPPPWLLCEPLA
jgi:hypothetical protein